MTHAHARVVEQGLGFGFVADLDRERATIRVGDRHLMHAAQVLVDRGVELVGGNDERCGADARLIGDDEAAIAAAHDTERVASARDRGDPREHEAEQRIEEQPAERLEAHARRREPRRDDDHPQRTEDGDRRRPSPAAQAKRRDGRLELHTETSALMCGCGS